MPKYSLDTVVWGLLIWPKQAWEGVLWSRSGGEEWRALNRKKSNKGTERRWRREGRWQAGRGWGCVDDPTGSQHWDIGDVSSAISHESHQLPLPIHTLLVTLTFDLWLVTWDKRISIFAFESPAGWQAPTSLPPLFASITPLLQLLISGVKWFHLN